MKKITLSIAVTLLTVCAVAQRPLRLTHGDIDLMRIQLEVERMQNARTSTGQRYIDLHPLEWIAVNVYKQRPDGTWTTAVTGWRTDYGDSIYIYKEVPPNSGPDLRMFSDTVNWGDAEVIPGPTGMFRAFSILKYWHDWKSLILEKKPWPSQKMWRQDTTQVFTGGASPGTYKYKFFCDLRREHVSRVMLVDQYLGTERPIGLKDTFEHVFSINAGDPVDSLSRRPDRFLIIAYPPLPIVGSEAAPTNSFSVSPNPAPVGMTVTMRITQRYEYGSVSLKPLLGGDEVLLRKRVTGQSVPVPIPSRTPPGYYALILRTPTATMSQKIHISNQ